MSGGDSSRMHLELADGKTRYRPGDTLEGVAFWELDDAPKSIEVRLYWETQGKGTVDLEMVQSARFEFEPFVCEEDQPARVHASPRISFEDGL